MVSSLSSCRLPCTPLILGKREDTDRGSRAQTPVSTLAGSHLHGKRTPGSVFQDGQPVHPRAGGLRSNPSGREVQTEAGHGRPLHPFLRGGGGRGNHPSAILQRINPAQVVPVLHTLGASNRVAPVSYPPVTQATISRRKSPSLVQLGRKPGAALRPGICITATHVVRYCELEQGRFVFPPRKSHWNQGPPVPSTAPPRRSQPSGKAEAQPSDPAAHWG